MSNPLSSPNPDRAAGGAGAIDCLTVDAALEYVQGRGPDADGARVQQHLDECARCRLLVSEAARGIEGERRTGGRAVMTGRSHPIRTLRDGERLLGRYEIVRFVARGGMGEVYEARDTLLDERVALKTLACTLLDDGRAMDRFVAEVQLARKVAHENVCRIFEFGIHRKEGSAGEESIPFLTMEFMPGETLGKRIERKGRLGENETLHVLRQMAAGLDAVHAAGIVHRDFKSDNVFVLRPSRSSTDGDERRLRRVVVMDFGLARSHDGLRARGWTTGPFIVGTVDYMAPEQLEGKPATSAFDVYALGVVLYEMLTGRRPHAAAAEQPDKRRFARSAAPVPSSLVPGLDLGWDQVIGRCLELDPARRFSSVRDVLAAAETMMARRVRRRALRAKLLPIGVGLAIGAATAMGLVAALRLR